MPAIAFRRNSGFPQESRETEHSARSGTFSDTAIKRATRDTEGLGAIRQSPDLKALRTTAEVGPGLGNTILLKTDYQSLRQRERRQHDRARARSNQLLFNFEMEAYSM